MSRCQSINIEEVCGKLHIWEECVFIIGGWMVAYLYWVNEKVHIYMKCIFIICINYKWMDRYVTCAFIISKFVDFHIEKVHIWMECVFILCGWVVQVYLNRTDSSLIVNLVWSSSKWATMAQGRAWTWAMVLKYFKLELKPWKPSSREVKPIFLL